MAIAVVLVFMVTVGCCGCLRVVVDGGSGGGGGLLRMMWLSYGLLYLFLLVCLYYFNGVDVKIEVLTLDAL